MMIPFISPCKDLIDNFGLLLYQLRFFHFFFSFFFFFFIWFRRLEYEFALAFIASRYWSLLLFSLTNKETFTYLEVSWRNSCFHEFFSTETCSKLLIIKINVHCAKNRISLYYLSLNQVRVLLNTPRLLWSFVFNPFCFFGRWMNCLQRCWRITFFTSTS